jgi:hypothetical protein
VAGFKKLNIFQATKSLIVINYLGELSMWIITAHSKNSFKMFEFHTKKEANEVFERIQGYKILTEVIYFNDQFSGGN